MGCVIVVHVPAPADDPRTPRVLPTDDPKTPRGLPVLLGCLVWLSCLVVCLS